MLKLKNKDESGTDAKQFLEHSDSGKGQDSCENSEIDFNFSYLRRRDTWKDE